MCRRLYIAQRADGAFFTCSCCLAEAVGPPSATGFTRFVPCLGRLCVDEAICVALTSCASFLVTGAFEAGCSLILADAEVTGGCSTCCVPATFERGCAAFLVASDFVADFSLIFTETELVGGLCTFSGACVVGAGCAILFAVADFTQAASEARLLPDGGWYEVLGAVMSAVVAPISCACPVCALRIRSASGIEAVTRAAIGWWRCSMVAQDSVDLPSVHSGSACTLADGGVG